MLCAQNPNTVDSTSDEPLPDSPSFLRINFTNRPSVRFGEFANIDVKGKWDFDFRGFSPPIYNAPGVVTALPSTPPTYLLTKARVGVKGRITKFVDYEIERDMRST